MAENDAPLTLRVLTPTGVIAEEPCEAVSLVLPDGADGRGGGSLGIRKGHIPAVAALCEGIVSARRGTENLRFRIPGGFASVENDIVTVITDTAEKII